MADDPESRKQSINALIFTAFLGWCGVAALTDISGWAVVAGIVVILMIGAKNNAPTY